MACDKPNPAYCGLPQIQISGIGQGPAGTDGASAYEIWLRQGNTGTVADFLAALKGPRGAIGLRGESGPPGLHSDALPAVSNGKDGMEHPVAYFTGARFHVDTIADACDKLTLLSGSRRLDLGTVPFKSGTYLLHLNLQFAWTGQVAGDLNGNCWVYQDETPLFEIDWGRLHRGTGWNFGTIATLNDAFVATVTEGASLSLRASAAFILVGGSLSVFSNPNYVVGEEEAAVDPGSFRYIKISFEYWQLYAGQGKLGNEWMLVNNIQVSKGGGDDQTIYPPTAMTSSETPPPYAVTANAGSSAWKAFRNDITADEGWLFRSQAVQAGGGPFTYRYVIAPYVVLDLGEARKFDTISITHQPNLGHLGIYNQIYPMGLCVYVSNNGSTWRPYWRSTRMLGSNWNNHFTIYTKYRAFFVSLIDDAANTTAWPDAVEFQDEDGYWFAGDISRGQLPTERRWIAVRVQYNTNAIAANTVDIRLGNTSFPEAGCFCGVATNLAGTWQAGVWKTFDLFTLQPSWVDRTQD